MSELFVVYTYAKSSYYIHTAVYVRSWPIWTGILLCGRIDELDYATIGLFGKRGSSRFRCLQYHTYTTLYGLLIKMRDDVGRCFWSLPLRLAVMSTYRFCSSSRICRLAEVIRVAESWESLQSPWNRLGLWSRWFYSANHESTEWTVYATSNESVLRKVGPSVLGRQCGLLCDPRAWDS